MFSKVLPPRFGVKKPDCISSELESLVRPCFCWDSLNAQSRRSCFALQDGDYRLHFSSTNGQVYGWDLAGLAQEFWNSVLAPRIQQHYKDRQGYILKDSYWAGNVKCFMIGPEKANARPTVLILCQDTGITNRFAKVIRYDARFKSSGFGLRAAPQDIEYRAGNDLLGPSFDGITGSKAARTLFSLPIDSRIGSSSPRLATLGGYIRVGTDTFGLTVNHVFRPPQVSQTLPTSEMSEQTLFLYDPLEDSSDDELEEWPPKDHNSYMREISLEYTLPASTSNNGDQPRAGKSADVFDAVTGDHIGTTKLDSEGRHTSSNGLDWALVDLDSAHLMRLLELKDVWPTHSLRLDPPAFAVLAPPIASTSENRTDRIPVSSTKTLIHLPGTSDLQAAYAVRKVFEHGSCGSWILDADSYDAFGFLVAVAPLEQLSYVVALHAIFGAISQAWEVPVAMADEKTVGFNVASRNDILRSARPSNSHSLSPPLDTLEEMRNGQKPSHSGDKPFMGSFGDSKAEFPEPKPKTEPLADEKRVQGASTTPCGPTKIYGSGTSWLCCNCNWSNSDFDMRCYNFGCFHLKCFNCRAF